MKQDLKDDEFARQIVAELVEMNEEAFVILASALADAAGREATAAALQQRLATAKAAGGHPMALAMLNRALKTLKAS